MYREVDVVTKDGLLCVVVQVIKELAKKPEYSELLMQNGAIPALHRILQTIHDCEVQTPIVQAIGNIAASGSKQRSTVGTTPGIGTLCLCLCV